MKSNRHAVCVSVYLATLTLLLSLFVPRGAEGATVAYWQFEPGNLEADSSGNGNTLAVSGIASSADVASNVPGAGSAYFDGTASASVPLTLSAYTNLTVEWFMKVTNTSGLQIFMELSPNYNFSSGTFIAYINELETNLTVANNSSGVYNRDTPYLAGEWHHYAMTIDSSAAAGDKQRVQIYVDGVRMDNANSRFIGGASTSFGDYTLYIGARSGGGFFFANNWLDEIRISDRVLTPNEFLAPTNYPNSSIGVLQSPADTTAATFTSASFQAMANVTNAPQNMLAYAWQRSGDGGVTWTNIPGANGLSSSGPSLITSYSISSVVGADDGSKFRVAFAEIAGQAVTNYTATATLHINTDATPDVREGCKRRRHELGITFSEVLDTNSSLAVTNYSVVGTTITNVIPIRGGKSVLLQGDTLLSGNSFTGQVSFVKDLAGNSMPATPVSGPIEGLTLTDIGGAVATFSSVTNQYVFSDSPGVLRLYNGYGQTAGTADGCWYVWTRRTNDFDIAVQVTNVDTVGVYSRGGLMMNESLTPGSRNVTMGAYSLYIAYMQPYARFTTDGGATAPAPGGFVGYSPFYGQTASPLFIFPNIWIRMQRTGNILTEYWGTNGVTWNTQGTIDLSSQMAGDPFPSAVYIGVFSDPEDTAAEVGIHADYKNFGDTINVPTLSIQQSAGTVTLSWPATSTGFSLESRSSLSSGNWQPVNTQPAVQNGTNVVSLPIADTVYYHLVRPLQ